MKKDLLAIIIIFIASILLSWPLLKPGFPQIHDDQQIARLFVFDQALKSGQFPVRWVDDLGFGYGYPLFVFYPPFVYFLGELFHLVGFGFIDSIKLVFFLSILVSGIAMYIFARQIWGKFAATVAAFFYIFVPYRALDIYVRGALAESFSFVWLPLILWSFYKLSNLQERSDYKLFKTNQSLYIYLSAIFLALLMITHNLIFLPFMLLLPIYLIFLLWKSTNKKSFIVNCFMSIVISLALSAFFWIPALWEKKYTIVDQLLLVNLANYKIHFVYPQQLWNWAWGFGGSAEGLADGISFKIGKLHVLVSIGALILAIIYLLIKKVRNSLSIVNCQLSIVFVLLFILSAFMTTFYSKLIWDLVKPLAYLQFPWRFLTFTALFSSILAGTFVYLLKVPIVKMVTGTCLIFLLFIPNFKLFKPQTFRLDLTDEVATSTETLNWYVSGSSFEYLPKGVELVRSDLGTNVVNIQKKNLPTEKVEIVSGLAQINQLTFSPERINFEVVAQEETRVRANLFNFPGWQVKIDGHPTAIDDQNRLKLVTFDVPQGRHQVNIEFKNTLDRIVANAVSLVSFLLILAFALSRLKFSKFSPKTTEWPIKIFH